MRRRILILAGVALGLLLLLRGVQWLDQSGASRAHRARAPVPRVVGGQDLSAETPRRADDEDFDKGVLLCGWEGEGPAGSLTAFAGAEHQEASGDQVIRMDLDPGLWTVVWTPPDGAQVQLGTVDIESGEVHSCTLARGFQVQGHVVNLEGEPLSGVIVRGCGTRGLTDGDGLFIMEAKTAGCSVQAIFQDGLLSRRSKPVVVGALADEDIEIEVDDRPVAGIGIAFDPSMEGSWVQDVRPGTPAEEAGIQPGDLIVELDGKPVGGIEEDEFINLATGAEGSVVEITVMRDGNREHMRLRRERLAREDTGM